MKIKTIDNVIYPNFPQWKLKQKEEELWATFADDMVQDVIDKAFEELVAFFGEDTARRKENTVHHRRYEELREEGRMEEAMIEWNKKK